MTRKLWPAILAIACSLWLVPAALACSSDDTAYFDGFLDTTCVNTLSNTELDVFGGLRLSTDGTRTSTAWTSDTDFTSGVTYQSKLFAPVGASSLSVSGSGAASSLRLLSTGVPLLRDAANPVLPPTASDPGAQDNDNVDDPSVVRVGNTYVMYYSGTAEDGGGPAIFRATSTDGKSWTKTGRVLQPTAGSGDAHGVFAPDVLYDAGSGTYTMYYSGKGDTFGAIFQATSTDGIVWTKYDADADSKPDAVLDHGRAGSPDSFAAQDPSVIQDGSTWKMWYTGDDSNRKRVAYATSADGTTWTKGGKVISPEDGLPANLADGAFAPTVWKDGTTYRMILSGLKLTGGSGQTKLINASSSDGISWTIGSIALNQAGTNSSFDYSNLNSPFVLLDPTAAAGQRSKLYYSGNTIDPVTGGFHTRIGLATSTNGTSWNRFAGSGTGSSDLDTTALAATEPFDARDASGLAALKVGTTFVGFYSGNRGYDFKPRLGGAASVDGSAWTKTTDGSGAGGAILDLGSGFDAGGERDPSALYSENLTLGAPDYHLYFTALSSSGTESIGYANAQETLGTLLPDDSTWGNKAQILTADGSGFDANGVSDPYAFDDTAGSGDYVLYYTGTDASGNTAIGCTNSTTIAFASPTGCNGGTAIVAGSAGSFDKDGVKDPVVTKIGSTYYLFYTGIEKISDPGGDTRTIERIGYATSSSAASGWVRQGLVLDPSLTAYSFDENGVEPSGITVDAVTHAIDLYYTGVDRRGQTRSGHGTGDSTVSSGSVENGSATYQLGDSSTTVQDWRDIASASSGATEIWVSFLQPYSTASEQFWSGFFPVDAANKTAVLDFLLTVKGVRWQVREKTPAGNPSLDSLTLGYAPVHFTSSGTAITKSIAPPSADKLMQWRTLTVTSSSYDPTSSGGTSGGMVHVFDASGSTDLVPAEPLSTNGDTTINLTSISVTDHPALRVQIDMTSGGAVSPLVSALKTLYYTDKAPPPTPSITLTAAPATVDSGQPVTLSGTLSSGGTPLVGQVVTLLSQPVGTSGFTPLTTVTTDSAGRFSLTTAVAASTDYEASYSGTTSAPARVTVNPPKVDVTLGAVPSAVVFGQPVTLAGHLSQAGTPLVNQSVQLLAGTTPFGAAATNAAGDFSITNVPSANTVYSASFPNAAGTPTASVGVHKLIRLKATRRGRTGSFKGTIAPSHPNAPVVIQVQKGKSFVTFARTKTASTSAFSIKRPLKACHRYSFRATSPADADHLDGTSTIVFVEKHRIVVKVKAKRRTVTVTGRVSPAHRSGTVLLKEIMGKRALKLAKARITKKSTFRFVKKLKKGTHKLRVDMAADRCHFAGSSAVRTVKLR